MEPAGCELSRWQRTFAPAPDAPRLARRWVGDALEDRGIGVDQPQDVLLIVSELVANAVQHGAGRVDVGLHVEEDHVEVRVADQGHGPTAVARADVPPLAPSGRGLAIVAGLSLDWGTRPRTDGPGTVVWARVARSG